LESVQVFRQLRKTMLEETWQAPGYAPLFVDLQPPAFSDAALVLEVVDRKLIGSESPTSDCVE